MDALKKEYIERYQREYGIQLRAENMAERNAGMRDLSKKCANTLYDKKVETNDYISLSDGDVLD